MRLGFENEATINGIFAVDDIFTGSEINYIVFNVLDMSLGMDLFIKSKVINPPKEWLKKRKKWDFIAMRIILFGIEEFHSRINYRLFTADTFAIRKELNTYTLEVLDKNGSFTKCKFTGARIGDIEPFGDKDRLPD